MNKKVILGFMPFMATGAFATVYTDSVNDVNMPGNAYFANMDIKQVTMTNDATNLYVSIQLNGSITSSNWGKYCMMFQTGSGGDTGIATNPWKRSVGMAGGMNYWVGSWVDGGASSSRQLFAYSGGAWGSAQSDVVTINNDTESFTIPLASMGLSLGSTFKFDALSSGGNDFDSGWDLLSRSDVATNSGNNSGVVAWQNEGTVSNGISYQVVPEPASFLALGLGAVAMLRRKRS